MRARALVLSLTVYSCGAPNVPAPDCSTAVLRHVPATGGAHVACSAACGNGENPPTGGAHCGSVLACRKYDAPQNRCEWVHNLEHGHAVLLYNCPTGCPDELAELATLRTPRALLAPDPTLPTRFAAVVWGWSHTSDALDANAIRCVLAKQDSEAPEPRLPCPL